MRARFFFSALAGACLPDLALAGRMLGLTAFRRAHQWPTLRRLAAACWDEERAIAVGYASHLLADVVAHNSFVPEHERRILDIPHVTHALCEWAMDDYVRTRVTFSPSDLLSMESGTLAEAAARTFRCRGGVARRAICSSRARSARYARRACRRFVAGQYRPSAGSRISAATSAKRSRSSRRSMQSCAAPSRAYSPSLIRR